MTFRFLPGFLKGLAVFSLICLALVILTEYLFEMPFRKLDFYVQFIIIIVTTGIIQLTNILISNYHSKKGGKNE